MAEISISFVFSAALADRREKFNTIGEDFMSSNKALDKIAISVKSHQLLKLLLRENPKLEEIMRSAKNEPEALVGVRNWVMGELQEHPEALQYYRRERTGREALEALGWSGIAAIRVLDYIDNADREFVDLNLRGELAVSNPIKLIWLAATYGTGGAKPYFFEDMLHLFRQLSGTAERNFPGRAQLEAWMERYPAGLDPRIITLREENRDRILNIIIDKIDSGRIVDPNFKFPPKLPRERKFRKALEWWNDYRFHLRFSARSPEASNEMLGHSLDPDTLKILKEAEKAGIPFFANPYYLSLLHVRVPYFAIGADLAIRDYVIYSRQLVSEFGKIAAWEKEDLVEPGKPNAALRKKLRLPFLATDRNVLNLPGVGKSLTFRVIGITRYGRRILEFDHDATRVHSPIIEKMGRVAVIESKSIKEYLDQLEGMGENVGDYSGIWGYSIGETEPRLPIYEYPDFDFKVTDEITHLELGEAEEPRAENKKAAA